jgi:hypothetical protein
MSSGAGACELYVGFAPVFKQQLNGVRARLAGGAVGLRQLYRRELSTGLALGAASPTIPSRCHHA